MSIITLLLLVYILCMLFIIDKALKDKENKKLKQRINRLEYSIVHKQIISTK